MLGEIFEGVMVNLTLANPAGRPITLTMSNDGDVPRIDEGSPIEVHFAADNARVLPAAGLASAELANSEAAAPAPPHA